MTQRPPKLLRVRIVDLCGCYAWALMDGRKTVAESPHELAWTNKLTAKRNAERVLLKLISVGWEWAA